MSNRKGILPDIEGEEEESPQKSKQITLDEISQHINSKCRSDESEDLIEHVDVEEESLPTFLPDDQIPPRPVDPHKSDPEYCDQCGARYPYAEPLETGKPPKAACSPMEVEDCNCCVCPHCEARSIYHRQSKLPPYRCRNPDCEDREFEEPKHPIDNEPRNLIFWSCRACGEPTLAPPGMNPFH